MSFWKGGGKKRRDQNEPEIIQALQAVGATVYQISGRGLPDLLVAYRGTWTPLEVKSVRGRFKPTQSATKFPLARTVHEALIAIGAVQ